MNLHRKYWLIFSAFIIGTICAIIIVEQLPKQSTPPLNFTLTAQNGSTLTYSDINQRPAIIFFGFTGCDSICPTTLASLSSALKKLGKDAKNINILFISVDPYNDNPEKLTAFLQNFDQHIIGLTGNEVALKQLFHNFDIYVNKVGEKFDHSGYLYGFRRKGFFDETVNGNIDSQSLSNYMRSLINKKGVNKNG